MAEFLVNEYDFPVLVLYQDPCMQVPHQGADPRSRRLQLILGFFLHRDILDESAEKPLVPYFDRIDSEFHQELFTVLSLAKDHSITSALTEICIVS